MEYVISRPSLRTQERRCWSGFNPDVIRISANFFTRVRFKTYVVVHIRSTKTHLAPAPVGRFLLSMVYETYTSFEACKNRLLKARPGQELFFLLSPKRSTESGLPPRNEILALCQ